MCWIYVWELWEIIISKSYNGNIYSDCKKFEGIIYLHTLRAKINSDGSEEKKKKKKKWIGERETPTVCELRNDTYNK